MFAMSKTTEKEVVVKITFMLLSDSTRKNLLDQVERGNEDYDSILRRATRISNEYQGELLDKILPQPELPDFPVHPFSSSCCHTGG